LWCNNSFPCHENGAPYSTIQSAKSMEQFFLLQKLTVYQLVKKSPILYAILQFIIKKHTVPCQCKINPMNNISDNLLQIYSNINFSHLRQDLRSGSFLQVLCLKPCTYLQLAYIYIYIMHVTCPFINPPCFRCPEIMNITNDVTSHYAILSIVGEFLPLTSKYSKTWL
jgi:hypothetical protein